MPHRSRRPTDSPEKPLWLSFALTMTLLLASAWAQATPPAQEPDALTALAREPYWHQLLRDRTPDDGRYLSPVTQTGFFLSPDGARDAAAELRALVSRLNQPATNQAPNDHPACRFPARVLWLRSQLPLQAAAWPQPACPDLDTWLQALDTAAITLVFASDYLNNPSSMFGHTLLRLDARTQTDDTRLLAYAINYSAQTATSNGLEFAVQHVFGDSGFGTGINGTLVDGDVEYDNFVLAAQAILPGLSNSANWQVFYEKHGWSVKLTAAWRDEYLAGQGQPDTTDAPPNYVEEYLQWDLSVNYEVNDNLTVFFEGINLTNEYVHKRGRFANQLLLIEDSGRRIAFGVRGTF